MAKSPEEWERARAEAFGPLASELGWVVYEWNRLQAALAELFTDIVSPDNRTVPFAIWHSQTNERAQREMLRAALDAAHAATASRAHKDIIWLLNKVDALAGKRNDALHCPLVFIRTLDARGENEGIEISPMDFFGNPRAKTLRDKPLLEEFKWYRDHLSRLAQFSEALHYAITFLNDYTWPDRPELPPRDQDRNAFEA